MTNDAKIKKPVQNGYGASFKLVRRRPTSDQGSYSSTYTRYASLQAFMGGAEVDEKNPCPQQMPHDESEDLESRFNSGANRTDLPSAYGPANIVRVMGPSRASLRNDIKGWMRKKGEPL